MTESKDCTYVIHKSHCPVNKIVTIILNKLIDGKEKFTTDQQSCQVISWERKKYKVKHSLQGFETTD